MKLKWKRKQAGIYRSADGVWQITREAATRWRLEDCEGSTEGTYGSKMLAQRAAERQLPGGPVSVEPAPRPARQPLSGTGEPVDRLTVDLLQANLASMDMAIRQLAAQIGFLREAVDRLAKMGGAA